MHYACIVGVNYEWPEQRKTLGDIGLARCLTRFGHLDKNHLIEIYDEKATRSNVLNSLDKLLEFRNQKNVANASDTSSLTGEDDILLLYYGGHGKREEACTYTRTTVDDKIIKEPCLRYDEIIELLEQKFCGGIAWIVLDCCHSGGFGETLMERSHALNKLLTVKYGCIMSVPPQDVAGMEWTITECLIKAFKGELLCCEESNCVPPYLLSTRKGKHNINSSVPVEIDMEEKKVERSENLRFHPTWEQVIDFLADEIGRVKANRLTTLFCGKGMEDGTYLKNPCIFGKRISDTVLSPASQNGNEKISVNNTAFNQNVTIPRDMTWKAPFIRNKYALNDEVYVKWQGRSTGSPSDAIGLEANVLHACHTSRYIIGWLPARIVSLSDTTISIQIYDVISETSWIAEQYLQSSSQSTIICGLPFGFQLNPLACIAAVTWMAKHLIYLDTTIPPWTHIKVKWTDEKTYCAKTTFRTTVAWEHVKKSVEECKYTIGPYISIEWDEEDAVSIVPLSWCTIDKIEQRSLSHDNNFLIREQGVNNSVSTIPLPIDVVLDSFTCSKKILHGKSMPILNDVHSDYNHCCRWEAYDAEDCEYLPVQILNCVDVSSLPLQVLAYHMCYGESGSYSVVFWEDDSVLSLVPDGFLRIRLNSDSSISKSSESGTITEDSED